MTKFITPYNGLAKRVQHSFNLPSLTDQSASQEADIGFIIENFVKTGQLPKDKAPQFVDCTCVQGFDESMALVSEVKTQFELLPAKERSEFKNASNWVKFISDPSNMDVCIERGYLPNNKSIEKSADISIENVKDVNKTLQSDVVKPPETTEQ